jgi:general secretion pathway protein D
MLAASITMLYSQMFPGWGMGMGGWGMGMGGMGMGGMGMGMPGMGGYGVGMGGMGGWGMGMPGMGMYPGMGGFGPAGAGAAGAAAGAQGAQGAAGAANLQAGAAGMDLTGAYLGMGGMGFWGARSPRVVPNLTDNSLLILATPEEYDSILRLLRELDIPPRQVLIEAKIFELQLTGALSWGLDWFLKNRNASGASSSHSLTAEFTRSSLNLSSGWLLRQSKELLAALSTSELATRTRVISTPSVLATDSIPASINVGVEVPMLTAQAVTGVQQGGSSLFANTITNRKTGVNLSITANVNPSGVVTLVINQEVSSPGPPPVGGIQSPSFSNRNVTTQVTVQDGDTIAIGGIISESNSQSSGGVPFLHRIPVLGAAFGNKSFSRERTELLVFITPRVVYDTNEVTDASDELVQQMRRLQKMMR